MTNHQLIFIGSCLIMGSGVIGLSIGILAMGTNEFYGYAVSNLCVGAFIAGLIFAGKSLNAMLLENKKEELQLETSEK